MKNTIILLGFLLSTIIVSSQTIYSKAYGNPNDKPLIFLHGGPGYNSVVFEVTTAQLLSENGFYVITYDRRGEGRSLDENTKFTFRETFDDIHLIYDTYDLKSATLIGHSFGGIIATLYAQEFPDKTNSIVLVSSPLSMQETFLTILESSKSIYEGNNDSVNLNYIDILEKMDKNSLEYSSYCFSHAMQNGFYSPKEPTKEALNIYSKFRTENLLIQYSSQMTMDAPVGFWTNEKHTSLDLKDNLKKVIENTVPVFGLYGKDDGLFSENQIKTITSIIGEKNIEYISHCSHNLFVDQQIQFINSLKKMD